MVHLFASLPHILIGAIITCLILIKDSDSFRRRFFILIFSSGTVVSPDVLKVMGVLSSHSLWLVPFLGLIFSFIYVQLSNKDSLIKVWGKLSLIILFGHIFIDYIGNGARLLYPFVKEDLIFSIISKLDLIFIMFLMVLFLVAFFHQKRKFIAIVSLLVISLYFSALTFSKLQLEYSLKKKYKDEDIILLISYPYNSLTWGYQVRTENVIVVGESPITSSAIHVETRREI